MNWSDKEPLVYSCYYDYQLLGYLEYPYMGYENYPTTIEEDIAKYFELPEGFDKEKIGWQNVGWEYEIDETKPLIKVEESLTEETLTEGPHLKSTWLDSVYSAKKYFIFKKTKGSASFEKDAKVFTKINDAIKYATELSKKTDIIATSIRSDNKTSRSFPLNMVLLLPQQGHSNILLEICKYLPNWFIETCAVCVFLWISPVKRHNPLCKEKHRARRVMQLQPDLQYG